MGITGLTSATGSAINVLENDIPLWLVGLVVLVIVGVIYFLLKKRK